MKLTQKLLLMAVLTLGLFMPEIVAAPNIVYKNGDFEAVLAGVIETQTTIDINGTLLKKGIHDKLVANKTKIDLSLATKGDCAKSKITARNKVVWGNHKVIYTDMAWLTTVNAVATGHSHNIGANMIWLREIWVELDITKSCKMTDILQQTLTIGSFPLLFGRGIALGAAYSVNPAALGFFQDNTVDQFAWGAKVSGGLIKDHLKYDIYLSILSDQSTSLRETNFPTQLKAFGTSDGIVRGAGQIGYILGGRFIFTPITGKTNLKFEPYALHHHDPEQKLEFFCDAKANLTTAGFAVECNASRFELGFDTAVNFGSQDVKGWDRNTINFVNSGGIGTFVYSEVCNVDPNVVTPTAANNVVMNPENKAVNKAIAAVTPGVLSNGALIAGTTDYNSLSRYRAPYKVAFGGFMFVGDVAFWLIPKDLSLNATAGISSGDQNPHANSTDPLSSKVDGTYNGFIPIQELYCGQRVKSFFGMASGILRPLTVPKSGSKFATTVNNFTNLRFWGMGIKYAPEDAVKKWNVCPNMIMYWQDVASNCFDLTTGQSIDVPASKQLGVEGNIFFETNPSENVYISGGAAIFVPGQHYFDIQGKPTNAIQRALLDGAIATGKDTSKLPLISDDSAYSISLALGYTF